MIYYAYYGISGWIEHEELEPCDYEEEPTNNLQKSTYYPPYYEDENSCIWFDVDDFEEKDPVVYWLDEFYWQEN